MTEQEALKYLKDANRKNDMLCVLPNSEIGKSLIKALEKQIPKRPHKNFEKFSGVWCSCGWYLGKGCFVDNPNYCPNCGQAIDWSD